MFMKPTTKTEFNTACPHSSSLVHTIQDLNIVYVQNGHMKPSVWSLHSMTLLSSPLKINLLRKRTFISFPLLPYPFPNHRFSHLIAGPLPIPPSHPLAYTGCPTRNVPDFGRVFLMLKHTDITQNTYVQS